MKNRQWHITYKNWREYRDKDPQSFGFTESLCRDLNKHWPDCFTWAMWSLKHGVDPRLIDGAVNYVLKNKDNPKMTFYKNPKKYGYMNDIINDEGNQAAVADGRWQEIKMSDGSGMTGLNKIIGKVTMSVELAGKDREIAELKKQLERLKR